MTEDYNILQENEKRYPRFNGFGEMLFWSHANLQMLCAAISHNIIMVFKHCNSSKRDTDLLEWYFEQRREFPPVPILVHYLKQIYLYAKENDLLDKHREEMEQIQLPFNFRYIPLDYPQPEYYQ